jgi:hypothetical protein
MRKKKTISGNPLAALLLEDSYVITESGAQYLNKLPPQMFKVKQAKSTRRIE